MARSAGVAVRRAPPRLAKQQPDTQRPTHGRVTRSSSAPHHRASASASTTSSAGEPELNLQIPASPSGELQNRHRRSRRQVRPVGIQRRAPPVSKQTRPTIKSERRSRRPGLHESTDDHSATQDDGPCLPWAELPYLLLVEIFSFAAAPLHDRSSVSWLLGASTVCRAFSEPALTAMYRCPPLLDVAMAHSFVQLLEADPLTTRFNYRQKVQSLHIDVGLVAAPAYNRQHLDIDSLVRNCPRLTSLEFFHQKDSPPYRDLDQRLRWQYPAGLFESLAGTPGPSASMLQQKQQQEEMREAHDEPRGPILLRSWRWNSRLAGPEFTPDTIKSIHGCPIFSRLRKIAFVNYQRASLTARKAESAAEIRAMDKSQAEAFAGVFQESLPELKHLILESCTIANEHLVPLLPATIEELELINCCDVTAHSLSDFLSSRGRLMRQLVLHHNQSLSLGFLPLLAQSCPRLEKLLMNLTYYKHYFSYDDSQPAYEELLLPSQVPEWPRSIRVVAIENMRKWTPEAAEVFFQSFIDCSPNMPDLRVLSFKVMLDIPWRQRSAMREAWELLLKRCFARRARDPEPWRSVRDVPLQRDVASALRRAEKQAKRDGDGTSVGEPPRRRSGRISELSERSSRSSSAARGLRRSGPERISYLEPDTSDDDLAGDESEPEHSEGGENERDQDRASSGSHREDGRHERVAESTWGEHCFVHGLCDVVDIRFDNQKPTEIQFGMDDFMDQDVESLSDADWDGDDDMEDERYAW